MFSGFTKETSDFLWELSFNNERPWFLQHKEQFERCLNQPFRALAKDTLEQMQARYPERDWACHVSRIYRDARRLFGRGPYKDHLWFTVKDGENYAEGPMFWFELSAARFSYGLGYFDVTPAEMELFRRSIDAEPARFARLAESVAALRDFTVIGPTYARPKGDYAEPVSLWYNRKRVGVEAEFDFGGAALDPALPAQLAEAFDKLMPMYEFLLSVHRSAAATELTAPDRRSHGG